MRLFSSHIAQTDILNAIGEALPDRMLIFLDVKGDVIFRSNTLLNCTNCTVCSSGENIYNNLKCPIFEIFKIIPKHELKKLDKRIERTVSRFDSQKKKHLLYTSLEPIKVKDDSRIVYLFSIVDQTEFIKTEADLFRQRELLINIVKNLPNAVLVKDTEGRFLACNTNCEELLGASEEEAIGKSDYDFFEPELANETKKRDELVMRLGERRVNEEWLRYPDAHEELFETTKTPLYSKNGALLGVLGVSRKITKEKELQERLMLTQYSVDNAVMPIYWINSITGLIFYANDAACKSLGYTSDELTQLEVVDIDPNFNQDIWDKHVKKLNRARALHFQTLHRRKDGTIFPVEIIASIVNYQGKVFNIAFALDITERLKKEEALAKKEAMLRESQHIAKVGSWELDLQTKILTWSDETYSIFGIELGKEVKLEDSIEAIHPEDRQRVVLAYEASVRNIKNPHHDIVHRIIVGGHIRYVHEQCTTYYDDSGKPLYSIGTVRDVTDEQNLMDRVEYLSMYDSLTKLPNQLMIKEKLGYALKRSAKSKRLVAVCFIDLDDFKYINDLYSHEAGDKILQEIASRLKSVANDTYTLARFGADEFVVIMEDVVSPEKVINNLDKFFKALQVPFEINGETFIIHASAGISLSPTDASEVDDLIKFADIAMHQAKGLGRNRYAFYAQTLTEKMSSRMRMLNHLEESIKNEDFELYYQPQISLENMKVTGFEALLRWNHPQYGIINPNDFIPLAEESGFIIPLGKWVLKQACKQAKIWQDSGLFKGKIAVNVSGVQLDEGRFCDAVAEALHVSELEGEFLELEITETSLMSNQSDWMDELRKLDSLGVALAMDDFGTGYSSLAHLRKMRIDVLKIDQSFVFDLPEDMEACTVAKAIIGLSDNLKMKSLAEGVESASQLTFLKALGCGYAQGYFISKPMSAPNVGEFLDYWKNTHHI